MTKVVVVIGLFCAGICAARTPYYPSHERYALKHHRGGNYDLYIVWPKCEWQLEYQIATLFAPSCVSPSEVAYSFELLENVVKFVDTHSRRRGHVNARTEPHHLYEMEKLASGAWPVVFITSPGKPADIRMMVSVAVPEIWNEAPPFFRRFKNTGRIDFDALESSLWDPHVLKQGEDFWLSIFAPTAWGEPEVFARPDLSRIARHYPWALGAPAEFKFLIGADDEPHDLFYAIFHALSTRQLFRYNHVIVPEALRREQALMLNDPKYQAEQMARVDQSIGIVQRSPLAGRERQANLKRLFQWKDNIRKAKPFQNRLLNGDLYAQVSSVEGTAFKTLSRYFVSRVGFPNDMFYEFVEDEKSGTPGIRTRIYRFPASYFDDTMVSHHGSLNELHQQPYSLHGLPTQFQTVSCPQAVAL